MITPFKQAYVVTTEPGKIVMAVVEAEDFVAGETLAHRQILEKFEGSIWASCAFPVTDDLQLGVFEFDNSEYRLSPTPSL